MKIDFLKQLLKMSDNETWKKFTILQCLKKIKCVSMRHKKNCRPSMSEKNAPPLLLGLKIIHSSQLFCPLPPVSSLWKKMSTTPFTMYMQKINYPQHVKKCNPLRLIFYIPKLNCFYNFYKTNITVRHDKNALSEKTQMCVNEVWTSFCPQSVSENSDLPQIHLFQSSELEIFFILKLINSNPKVGHIKKHPNPTVGHTPKKVSHLVVRGDKWWTKYIHTNLFTIGVSGSGRYANIFEFIKTNHQYNIEILIKLHNIFIKLGILYGMLSFNDISI